MKKYVVTIVDYGETCDGKARVLGVKNTKVEAFGLVNEDMSAWYDENKEEGIEIDYDKMSAHFDYDSDKGCEWNVEEVEIEDGKVDSLKDRIDNLENEVANLKDRIKYR